LITSLQKKAKGQPVLEESFKVLHMKIYRDLTAASSHTDKQELERPTPY
jgi:hypothetical protein